MKTLAKIVGSPLAVLAVVLVILRFTGFNPTGDVPGPGNYPGLWLSGEQVDTKVTDWSFADQYKTDKVETRTWYGIPHSVTTSHILKGDKLYLTSLFRPNVPFPDGKAWVKNIAADPHVRLKFGEKLYPVTLTHVTDEQEIAAVLGERAKNPGSAANPAPAGSVLHLFRVTQE